MNNLCQKLCLRLLSLGLITFAAGTTGVVAQQSDEEPEARPDYQVELIVFEYLNPSATEEDWRGPTPAAEPDEITETSPSIAPAPLEFSRVEAEDFQLSEIAGRMRGSRDFRVVYHSAWIQPGYNKEEAPWLILGRVGRVPAKLRGRAKMHLSRYLHMELDLDLQGGQIAGSLRPGAPYSLLESRRMRSGDLHFFDHPKFGALVRIDPVDSDD
ncbi:MAG: CsiV family protein [Pseudomonadota bacterium]